MRYYYIEKTYLYVGFDYDAELVRELKDIGGFFWNPENKEWYREISLDVGGMLERLFREKGFVCERPVREAEIDLPEREEVISLPALKEAVMNLGMKRTPREYQMEGIHYMINHPNCVNGCAPGLGKTSMALVLAEALELFPCLVITPASVKYGWREEWRKWVDGRKRRIQVLESGDEWKPGQHVYILNYDILYTRKRGEEPAIRFPELARTGWAAVFIDEAHMCKNAKSLRSQFVGMVTRHADLVYPLTGTLVMNRPAELINILTITGWFKRLFKNWQAFVYRYCNAKRRMVNGQVYGWDITCASNTKELNRIISHHCYFRKEKRDVLTELPPMIESVVPVMISNVKEYKKAEDNLIDYLNEIDVEKADRAGNAPHLVKLSTLKDLSLKGKMKSVQVFLDEWKEISEEKLLVFGVRREPLQKLAAKYKAPIIQGGMSPKEKFAAVQRYKSGDDQFLFANIDAIGTGVDGLQECCSNLAYIELPDKFTTLDQANSRLERMGQRNDINIFYLLCPDTIDTYMAELVEEKKKVTDSINKGIDVDVSEIDVNFMLIKKLRASRK